MPSGVDRYLEQADKRPVSREVALRLIEREVLP
jgi:hypothetical protein